VIAGIAVGAFAGGVLIGVLSCLVVIKVKQNQSRPSRRPRELRSDPGQIIG
jgi:hypothetical protein